MTPDELHRKLTALVDHNDFNDASGTEYLHAQLEVERIHQLAIIAKALVAIEKTGVYTWPQDTEDDEPPRRRG